MLALEPLETNISKAMIRADRISRLNDKWLGRITIDEATVEELSESHAGLLAEGFVSLETMLGRVMKAAFMAKETQTIVLYASKEAGEEVYKQLVESGFCEPTRKPPEQWKIGCLWFTSVEGISRIEPQSNVIDAVVLLDPTCMVYRARTLKTYSGKCHDRPQIIVNFLADHVRNGVSVPFLIMTKKRAAALPTDAIARAFCLETFWFLDGPSMAWA